MNSRAYATPVWHASIAIFVAVTLVVFGNVVPAADASFAPVAKERSVSEFFQDPGPWEVTTSTVDVPAANGVTIFHPTDLGAEGYKHPVLTEAFIDDDQSTHLASWGNVVVRTDEENPGSGDEILAAAQWAVRQDSNPDSIFFETLDTDKVGALGFSQGAHGAVRATLKSNGLITSTIPIALPSRMFWGCQEGGGPIGQFLWFLDDCDPPVEDSWDELVHPVFYVTGSADRVATQPSPKRLNHFWADLCFFSGIGCGPNEQQYFFEQTVDPVARVEAVGVEHEVPMFYMGYLTAWFKYTLEDDGFARTAFVGSSPQPQIATDPAWTKWRSKGTA